MAVGEPGWISMVFSRPGVLRGAAARVTASTCKKKTGVVAVGRALLAREDGPHRQAYDRGGSSVRIALRHDLHLIEQAKGKDGRDHDDEGPRLPNDGSVTYRNLCHRFAPWRAVASYRSRGICCCYGCSGLI